MNNNQKIFIGILFAIIIAGFGYYFFNNQKNTSSNNSTSEPVTNNIESATSSQMSVSSTSGVSPLKVTFSNFPTCANEQTLSFGDNTESVGNGYTGSWPAEGVSHTYSVAGTYTATLSCSLPSRVLSTVTVTVK